MKQLTLFLSVSVIFLSSCESIVTYKPEVHKVLPLVVDIASKSEFDNDSTVVKIFRNTPHEEVNIFLRTKEFYNVSEVKTAVDLMVYRVTQEIGKEKNICFGITYPHITGDTTFKCYDKKQFDVIDSMMNSNKHYYSFIRYYLDSIPVESLEFYDGVKDKAFLLTEDYFKIKKGTFSGSIPELIWEYSKHCDDDDQTYAKYLFGLSFYPYHPTHSYYLDQLLMKCGYEPAERMVEDKEINTR